MAAAHKALELCSSDGEIHHLIVVPDFWKGMTGDDWLNNGSTRDTYRRYLESELGKEIDEHCEAVQQQAEDKGLSYHRLIVVGEPAKCLIKHSQSRHFDLIIMGSPRPKGVEGLRSRIKPESLVKALTAPLLIIPFPSESPPDV